MALSIPGSDFAILYNSPNCGHPTGNAPVPQASSLPCQRPASEYPRAISAGTTDHKWLYPFLIFTEISRALYNFLQF
jgi:hypothetical protein